MSRIWRILTRKKAIDPVTAEETRLNRVLNTFDLTALGVGSTLGVGVYVLAGQVAKDTAGPSVILSFLIAAIASVFAGLCYAEFGARAPRAGSAYIYSYVCVGEFIAFIIGWNLILEYVIGSASVARGLSLYLDTLINNTLQHTFRDIAPINVDYMSEYFDFFSFGISILLAVTLAFGMKESSMGNNIITVLNIIVILFVIVAGSLKANPSNWRISPDANATNSTDNIGKGGFFPFGIEGMIKGAATCFYGFVGFDCIATTGEEVKNPRKAIPISIIVSLFIIFCSYFGVATVLTLMVPYYLQDHAAPIPRAFEAIGWDWAKWIVAIGALFGLCASLFGAMFPLPRIIYAMGSDGLVFKFLAKIHPKFQTPVIGTICAGILTGLMSALFNLKQLVNMMSIGTLLAYTIVAASVLLLRYKEEVKKVYVPVKISSDTDSTSSESSSDGEKYNDDTIRQNFDGPTSSDEAELISSEPATCCKYLLYIFNYKSREPTRITENIVAVEIFLYCILCVCIGLCAIYLPTPIINKEIWAISIASVVVGLTVIVVISIATQPTSRKELSFKVPLVPLIPALSIMVNIYLMLMLDYRTWIRFAVWMALGLPMYYICACTNKQPRTLLNGTNYSNNITNGQTKMSNGLSNPTFVADEVKSLNNIQITKKKRNAPSPPAEETSEIIDVQEDAVIAQLDQVLEKATLNEWDEDRLSDETVKLNDRKLSAESLSNLSLVMSHLENVVADVHRSDLSVDPSVVVPPVPHNDITETHELYITENVDKDSLKKSSGSSETITNEKDVNELLELPQQELNENDDNEKNLIDDSLTQEVSKHLDSKYFSQNVILDDEPAVIAESTNLDVVAQLNTNERIPKAPTPPPSPSEVLKEPTKAEVALSSYVPSEHALRTVTLRHVQKAAKTVEDTLNQNASDDNLKAGTDEFYSFMKLLNNKLKTRSGVPSLYHLPKNYIVPASPKQPERNENIIEDRIDREDARIKLKSFLEIDYQKNPQFDRSSSTDNTIELDVDSKKVPDEKQTDTTTGNEFKEHRDKMKHVFSSMKLKDEKPDVKTRKLSKSLGSSYKDHQRNHKQKMEDIFKSIHALKSEKE